MTYEAFHRKGTSRERKARALQLSEEYRLKLEEATQASKLANELDQIEGHLVAARYHRRLIATCSRLGADATIHREAVSRHIEQAETLKRRAL